MFSDVLTLMFLLTISAIPSPLADTLSPEKQTLHALNKILTILQFYEILINRLQYENFSIALKICKNCFLCDTLFFNFSVFPSIR